MGERRKSSGESTELAPPVSAAFCYYLDDPRGRPLSEQAVGERVQEAEGLVKAAGLDNRETLSGRLRNPVAATLLSTGLIEQARALILMHEAEVLYLDLDLSPVQQRNLERALHVKVIDRTALILEIFADRASTLEGELQVTLARFQYQRSRLVRSWTHLERQRGGRGFLGGPGETQIEADRRAIDERILQLKAKLEEVRKRRSGQRERRRLGAMPSLALVGYTNAGKTTLFERLTQQAVRGEDKLFATLDPLVRQVRYGHLDLLLSDTVGFIENLPTGLIAAFRATLEEVTEADLILHIRDAANPRHQEQAEAVYQVLGELGLDQSALEGKLIEVWNKIDLLDSEGQDRLLPEGNPMASTWPSSPVSALTGQGMEGLADLVSTLLKGKQREQEIVLRADEGKWLAWLHRHSKVLHQEVDAEGLHRVRVAASPDVLAQVSARPQ